jgi:hypothetical protein
LLAGPLVMMATGQLVEPSIARRIETLAKGSKKRGFLATIGTRSLSRRFMLNLGWSYSDVEFFVES